MGHSISLIRKSIEDTRVCSDSLSPCLEEMEGCLLQIQQNILAAEKLEEPLSDKKIKDTFRGSSSGAYRCYIRSLKLVKKIESVKSEMLTLQKDLRAYDKCYDE
jgi:hypothetical protein